MKSELVVCKESVGQFGPTRSIGYTKVQASIRVLTIAAGCNRPNKRGHGSIEARAVVQLTYCIKDASNRFPRVLFVDIQTLLNA